MKKTIFLIAVVILFACNTKEPNTKTSQEISDQEKVDAENIKNFFDAALTEGQSYEWLRDLTSNVGGRLSGSPEAQKAVEWGEALMREIGLDSVWLQPVMVPHWVRGAKEVANYRINGKLKQVPICALGFSVATPSNGVTAEVIEVKSLEEAEALGLKMKDKIVFFNRPFDNTLINTFKAYGGCVDSEFRELQFAENMKQKE